MTGRNILYSLFVICCCQVVTPLRAQIPGPLGDFLKMVQEHNKGTGIGYDYEIRLKRVNTNTIVDSIKGTLCKGPDHYRDSNTVSFTARVGDYYCCLNHEEKTARVYDLKLLSRKLNLSLAAASDMPAGITEVTMSGDAKVRIDTSNKAIYRLVFTSSTQKVSFLQLDLNRSDYSMAAAVIETAETEPGDPDPYIRIYRISHVRQHEERSLADLSGIFSLDQGKVVLSKKYSHYKLTELAR